jgi:hypothetical protein
LGQKTYARILPAFGQDLKKKALREALFDDLMRDDPEDDI